MTNPADTAHSSANPNVGLMYLIALLLVGSLAGAIVFAGLGGLILWGVGATWVILALLVIMTAGG